MFQSMTEFSPLQRYGSGLLVNKPRFRRCPRALLNIGRQDFGEPPRPAPQDGGPRCASRYEGVPREAARGRRQKSEGEQHRRRLQD